MIKRILKKWDIYLAYILLSLYILYNILNYFLPTWIESIGTLSQAVFAGSIILAIMYIIKLIQDFKVTATSIESSFMVGFQKIFSSSKSAKSILITAYTSARWIEAVSDLSHVNEVKILLFCPEKMLDSETENIGGKKIPPPNVDQIIGRWAGLTKNENKKINRLEIKKIKATALFYFGIIDGQKSLSGLLWPREDYGGLETGKSLVLDGNSGILGQSTDHLVEWFNAYWKDKRAEVLWP